MKVTKYFKQFWKGEQTFAKHCYTYFFFAILRIVLVFLPQTGYIHPDEFFQSVEVINGDNFRIEHIRTWEFNNSLPVRSMTLPFFIYRIAWSIYDVFSSILVNFFKVEVYHSYTYMIVPRLVMLLLSFVNDWSLFRLCRLYSLNFEIRMLALGSSWIMLTFSTRTFSNSIEMALCSFLLYLVGDCMIKTNTVVYNKEFLDEKYAKAESIGERVKIWKLKNSLPPHNFKHLHWMSNICVIGVFNRPTFFLFGAPMVFFWLLRGMGTHTITFRHFHQRMLLFVISALPMTCFHIFCDSIYYKYLTAGEIHMLDMSINNFVVTPWNFIKYNMNPENSGRHGIHPRYVHMFVNIPILYGVLGLIALVTFTQQMLSFFKADYQDLPRSQSIVSMMTAAIFVPVCLLSLINHQEARFLLPVTFPLIILHAPKLLTGFCTTYPFRTENSILRLIYDRFLATKISASYLLQMWYVCNISLTIFFGFIHQAGVFPLAQRMEEIMQNKARNQNIHLITSHIYNLPVSFMNIPIMNRKKQNLDDLEQSRQRDFYLYEYGSLDLDNLLQKMKLIVSRCEFKRDAKQIDYRLLLAIPTSLSEELSEKLSTTRGFVHLRPELLNITYPHLSVEAFPYFSGRHPCDIHPPNWADDDFKGTCAMEQSPSLSSEYVLRQFSSFVHQFGLALYEMKVRRRSVADLHKAYKMEEKQS